MIGEYLREGVEFPFSVQWSERDVQVEVFCTWKCQGALVEVTASIYFETSNKPLNEDCRPPKRDFFPSLKEDQHGLTFRFFSQLLVGEIYPAPLYPLDTLPSSRLL